MTIAFCFLTIGDANQAEIWRDFFHGSNEHGIFCHPKVPEAVHSDFLRYNIIHNRLETRYAHFSLVKAALNLFEAAYNRGPFQHFILLSESTIPVVSFREVETELAPLRGKSLINHTVPPPRSDHHGRQRALPRNHPFRPFHHHDQWIILSRGHVDFLLGRPGLDQYSRMYAADEHYFANALLHSVGVLADDIIPRRTTFVNWKGGETKLFRDESGKLKSRRIRPKTYHSISVSDVLEARGKGHWFFRKVSERCDCSHIRNFVLQDFALRDQA